MPLSKPALIITFVFELRASWTDLVLAASVIATVPMLIVFLVAQRYFVQGISTTGRTG